MFDPHKPNITTECNLRIIIFPHEEERPRKNERWGIRTVQNFISCQVQVSGQIGNTLPARKVYLIRAQPHKQTHIPTHREDNNPAKK